MSVSKRVRANNSQNALSFGTVKVTVDQDKTKLKSEKALQKQIGFLIYLP